MSVAAVMMVRDEADIVGHTIRHLLTQVDHVYVADNRSTDGTSDIVRSFGEDAVSVTRDDEVAYLQSEKTTRLAMWALTDGHEWVVPVDADEVWLGPPGHTVGSFVSRQGPDVQLVSAALYDHMPTSNDDPSVSVPQLRIGWRRVEPGVLPKVAARLHKRLTIHPGNHGADYGSRPVLQVEGLALRHFTWRTEDQYVRKIRNGVEAYADVARKDIGVHWRMHDGADDDQIRDHFRTWFYVDDPASNPQLVHDPLGTDGSGAFVRREEVTA